MLYFSPLNEVLDNQVKKRIQDASLCKNYPI